MLSKTLQEAINNQIHKEFESSYLYLAMAAYCDTISFPGFAKWLRVQSQEEWGHGMKLYDYLSDRGTPTVLQAIDAPPVKFGGPAQVFEQVLAHEQEVTASLNELYALAVAEKDYATQFAVQWFITEQVEEEKTARDIVDVLKMAGEHVIVMDHRLGKRGD